MKIKYAVHPEDVKSYDTQRLRREFLTESLFKEDEIRLTYTHYDRFIYGGVAPVNKSLKLGTDNELKAGYFLERRELSPGNIWNTFPPHTHERRMEVYFYFDLPEDQIVVHFMGQPQESRHLAIHNFDAVVSPPWSIHAGAGTAAYKFAWGMAGENKAFTDMDGVKLLDFK